MAGFVDAIKYLRTPLDKVPGTNILSSSTMLGKVAAASALAGVGVGAVVSRGMGGSSNLPARTSRHERLTYEDINSRGFWNKQKTLTGMSLMSEQGVRGYLGYAAGEAVATFTGPYANKGMLAGGLAGGAASLGALAFIKPSWKKAGGVVAAAVGSGAVLGGITARKVQLAVAESFNTVQKNLYKKPMFSNKARGVGPGYRLWAQRTTMGKPGHLGVTGSLPFAMHSARHKSTV